MTIPDYETLMLPVLKIAGDSQEQRIKSFAKSLFAALVELVSTSQSVPDLRPPTLFSKDRHRFR